MKRIGAVKRLNLALAVVAVVAMLALSGSPAQAQTGTTAVSVSLNPLVILYYYSNVAVTFSATDMTTVLGVPASAAVATASAGAGTNTAAAGSLTVSPATALTATPPTAPYTANLILLNNWGVRSIGQTGAGHFTQVAVTAGTSTLTNGTATITIGALGTRLTGGSTFGANAQFPPTGLGTVQYGDVQLGLTLTNASLSGNYTGGTYTLTASNL